MDQSSPQPGFRGGPPRTPLQQRVDDGEDPRAIMEELYRRLQQPLYRFARKALHDPGLAEEIVQRVFLKMQVNFDDMIARETADRWIWRVTRNTVVDVYRARKSAAGAELPADLDELERDVAKQSSANRFEGEVLTWVGNVEPVLVHLRALLAKGSLGDSHLRAWWFHAAEGFSQQELARQLGRTQGRISQLITELRLRVCESLYFCEILGLVRHPRREAEIRSHLDLFDLASGVTEAHRTLLRQAARAVRVDGDGGFVVRPKDAEVAIGVNTEFLLVTLHDLHDAESAYADAIPNPFPHCILAPCALHSVSGAFTEGERR